MKKLLLSIFLLSGLSVMSQNILDNKVTFKYTQLSWNKIHDGSKQYAIEVQMTYQQRNADSLAAFEQAKQSYNTTLGAYMDVWEQEKIKIDRQHLTNMVVYESQVAAGNTAATPPQKIPYPLFVPPARPKKPFLLSEIQANTVSSAIKIEGLTQNPSSGTKITIVFEGFEKGMTKVETKGTAPALKYELSVMYRHPITLKVEVPGKGIIINERYAGSESFYTWRSKQFNTKAELELWWMDNENIVWEERQRLVVNEITANLNAYFTNNFGYPVITRKIEVYSAKAKGIDYTDVQKAYSIMEAGLLLLAYPNKIAEAQAKFREAVALYEKILQESDLVDKKARIDKWVTACIYVNLTEAYIWLNDYSSAEITANKVINIGINKYEKDARALLGFIKDQRTRYEANQ